MRYLSTPSTVSQVHSMKSRPVAETCSPVTAGFCSGSGSGSGAGSGSGSGIGRLAGTCVVGETGPSSPQPASPNAKPSAGQIFNCMSATVLRFPGRVAELLAGRDAKTEGVFRDYAGLGPPEVSGGQVFDGLDRRGVRVRPARELVPVAADAGDLVAALALDGQGRRGPGPRPPSPAAARRSGAGAPADPCEEEPRTRAGYPGGDAPVKRNARRARISGRSAPAVRARRAHPGTHPPPSIRPKPLRIPSTHPSASAKSLQESGTFSKPKLECAPGSGQVTVAKLTREAGIRREYHGKTPDLQYRVQAPGGAGVSRRRDSARSFQASRHLAQPDSPLGGEVRGGGHRTGRAPGRPRRTAPATPKGPDAGNSRGRRANLRGRARRAAHHPPRDPLDPVY